MTNPRKISLRLLRASRDGMTCGRYGIQPGVRLAGGVMVEIGQRSYQVAMMTGDAPAADPDCPHVATQPGRNALGFAVMTNHVYRLLDIAEAALATREPITDEPSARARHQAELRLDAVLAKVSR